MYVSRCKWNMPWEKKNQFEDISLSARTCVRRTEDWGANLILKLKEKVSTFDCFSITTVNHELRYTGYGTECDKLNTLVAKMCQTT